MSGAASGLLRRAFEAEQETMLSLAEGVRKENRLFGYLMRRTPERESRLLLWVQGLWTLGSG